MPLTAATLPTYFAPFHSTYPCANPTKSNSTSGHADRNPDGTFTKGSELAKELGAQGGHAAHHESTSGDDGVSLTHIHDMKSPS
jgi:hypothetical protein